MSRRSIARKPLQSVIGGVTLVRRLGFQWERSVEHNRLEQSRKERFDVDVGDVAGGVSQGGDLNENAVAVVPKAHDVVDDRVVATDVVHAVETTWREWELELGPAAPTDHAAFFAAATDAVRAAGGCEAASASKLARALGL